MNNIEKFLSENKNVPCTCGMDDNMHETTCAKYEWALAWYEVGQLRASAAEADALRDRCADLTEHNREQAETIDVIGTRNKELEEYHGLYMGMPTSSALSRDKQIVELRATVAEQERQIEAAREMLDLILKNSREVSEGDCTYCNCEQGGGNEHDCYYDCPMNDVRAWLAANAPTPTPAQGETESKA